MVLMKWMGMLAFLVLLTTACGQKGDLYLPDKSAQATENHRAFL